MIVEPSNALKQAERIEAHIEALPSGRSLKIRLLGYDENLGWYTVGALSLPVHQLPLLQQALAGVRQADLTSASPGSNVIPFPGLKTDLAC
jgi:hypothetical protein